MDNDECIFYEACEANLYSAIKRQCIAVTQPDQNMVKLFFKWFEAVFDEEIVPILENFDYCEKKWYNQLTATQQAEIDKADCFYKQHYATDLLKKRNYGMFCKREKQIVDDECKNPKNRCICAPNAEYKFVMGPVVASLDYIFRKFKGYCAGKNWTELETAMNELKLKGLDKVVEGDGSGFDRTQTHELKDVERTIYRWLAHNGKIHHVPEDVFLHHVNIEYRTIYPSHAENHNGIRHLKEYGSVAIRGTVFSGDCDTTFGNSLRMALYNRFTIEKVLGIDKDGYDLWAKGDDFAVFLPDIPDRKIVEAYEVTFSRKKTGIHGLGQILKFLKIGSFETMDFCSTETFRCESCKSYKMIRQLSRFVTMNPWSHTVVSLSRDEQDHYLEAMYRANLTWMSNLPIFEEFNQFYHKRVGDIKPKSGRQKNKIEESHHWHPEKKYRHGVLASYDTAAIYTEEDRISLKKRCCADGFVQHLLTFYNITSGEVEQMQRDIVDAGNSDAYILLPSLIEGIKFKKSLPMELYELCQ